MKQTPEISQLHRAIGQLQAVEKMLSGNLKTSKIIQQIEAAKGSLNSLERQIIGSKCKLMNNPELKLIISYLTKL